MILKVNDRIRVRRVETFTHFEATLKYDAVASVFSWKFVFDPKNRQHVDLACIGHYHQCTLEHNGDLILTGQILSQFFHDEPIKQTTTMSGYSLPGVLEDCEIPPSAYPLQTDFMNLEQIAQKYLKPFGIKYTIDDSVSSRMKEQYEESSATAGQSLKSYLSNLASQKNIIISHDNKGRLLFTQPKATQMPVTHFRVGGTRWTGMTLSFDGQAMHSRIYVINQADVDDINESQSFVDNPYVAIPEVFRQKVIVMNSGNKLDNIDKGGGATAANNALAQELKNFKLSIRMDRWDVDGKIIRPGDMVSVTNPSCYIFKKTKWFVEEVALVGDESEQRSNLTCVLPEVYTGEKPEYIYKGLNLH